jgi:hypothetical protein
MAITKHNSNSSRHPFPLLSENQTEVPVPQSRQGFQNYKELLKKRAVNTKLMLLLLLLLLLLRLIGATNQVQLCDEGFECAQITVRSVELMMWENRR